MSDEERREHAELIHKWGCSDITPEQIVRLEQLDELAKTELNKPASRVSEGG